MPSKCRTHPHQRTSKTINAALPARQKLQRAFAAEFLCPIDALLEYMGNDFADAKMEDAGEHFGVSSLAIRSHLVNNDILPFDVMDIDSCRSVA